MPILATNFGQSHLGVDETEGNLYYVDAKDGGGGAPYGTVYGFDASGQPLGGNFPITLGHNVEGAAVDPLGYLWISGRNPTAFNTTQLSKYAPDGTLLETFNSRSIRNFDFDVRTGDMWAFGFIGGASIIRMTAESNYTEFDVRFPAPSSVVSDVDFDNVGRTIYLISNFGTEVKAYNESGGLIETFATGGSYRSLAVHDATGDVYLNDDKLEHFADKAPTGGKIRVWRGVTVPDVKTGPPIDIGHTNATVSGHVDLDGGPEVTNCKVEYVLDSAFNELDTVTVEGATGGTFSLFVSNLGTTSPIPYNATAAEVQAALEARPNGANNIRVTGPVSGTYTIEFIGALGNASIEPLFTTDNLTPSSATVGGTTVRQGGEGWSKGSPQSAPCVPAASPGSPFTDPTDVSADLSGLSTATTYRYRLVASNSNGTNVGVDETLIPQPSLTKTGAATAVTRTTATLNGTVDPEGEETTFYFEYGKGKNYGQTTAALPGSPVGTTEAGDRQVGAEITGLDHGVTYNYRLVAVNAKGISYGVNRTFTAKAAVVDLSTDAATDVDRVTATLNGTLNPDGSATTYYFEWGRTRRYGETTAVPPGDPVGTTAPGAIALSAPTGGLKPETKYHYRLVASNSFGTTYGQDRSFTTLPAVIGLSTEPATEVGTTTATLNGRLNPDGIETRYYFEWGKTPSYGQATPVAPGAEVGTTDPTSVPVAIVLTDLEPGTEYHYRVVGTNSAGKTVAQNQSFTTPAPPAIEGVLSENVTETSADLTARIDPNGFDTEYYFEYGKTPEYGTVLPVSSGTLPPVTTGQEVTVPLDGLEGVTYHFRLVVKSQWGTVMSEDQTFDFNPPRGCPNHSIRQQSGSAYLPDCRAYELVSPARASGTLLYPFGPSSPYAHDHFAFTGLGNVIPGTGEPPNGDFFGELYVASRTPSGWATRYVGVPGYQSIAQGGPHFARRTADNATYAATTSIFADLTLEKYLVWDRGQLSFPFGQLAEYGGSSAPYMFDSDGRMIQRLPTNLQTIPGGDTDLLKGGFIGVARPSPDMSHYVFSSRNLAFAEGGITSPPGSVYDNNLTTGTVTTASWTAAKEPIEQDPRSAAADEFMQVPAVSIDGSHILMSTTARAGLTHLYMRVDGAVTYEISTGLIPRSQNDGVKLEGMTPNGSMVYFTTREPLTEDDHDTSVDLFRWTGHNDTLTRLSAGTNGSGDTDSCNPGWVTLCNVEVVPTDNRQAIGQAAPPVDSPLAAESGDIYFYSPELLDGARGAVNKRNLYVWRDGAVKHVATLEPLGGAERINVSPDGAYMGFITKSKVTSYENSGRAQMYRYRPDTRAIICASCIPDGGLPSEDVTGSQNGRFMTDDGRTFFTTVEALVPRDANRGIDVYEYVEGRPQLISSGTGEEYFLLESVRERVGLVGVSADGVNVYFATSETLVNGDENGPRYKFYVARTNGGFPFNKPAAPCAAADECHGDSSTPPRTPEIGSSADLGSGGNAVSAKRRSCRVKAKTRAKKAKTRAKKCQKRGPRRAEKKSHRRSRGVTR